MDNYKMVTVEFKSFQRFRCLLAEWQDMGKYKGFLKLYHISIKEIISVKTEVLETEMYPSIPFEG